MTAAKSLRALQVVHMHVSYEFDEYTVTDWKEKDYVKYTPFGALLRLQILPLKTVMATMVPQPIASVI